MELLGITPGQPAPPPILQPPPDYPPLDRKPLELRTSDIDEYLLTVKQELRQQMQRSHFFLKAESKRRDVEKYSDRYQSDKPMDSDNHLGWEVNWNYFPKELNLMKRKIQRTKSSKHSPVVSKKRTSRKRTSTEKEDTVEDDVSVPNAKRKKHVSFAENDSSKDVTLDTSSKLSELERLEGTGPAEGAAAEEEEGEDVVSEEEVYDEEIEEEGTDYNLTYFDNGEDYLGGEEDTLEENEGPYY